MKSTYGQGRMALLTLADAEANQMTESMGLLIQHGELRDKNILNK